MFSDFRTPAARRYSLRFSIFMAVYVATIFGVSFWFRGDGAPQGVLRYAAAALPALPVLGVIWAVGAYMLELPDEYQRLRLATSMLWATGLTLAVCTVWGFLQNYAEVWTPPLYSVFILFMLLFGLAQCVTALRERR